MIDLFSGIGGFRYAAEQVWPDIECLVSCEIDPFCQKVLRKHWPGTPIISDIHKLKGTDYADVDLLTGGFPCQPYSVAGQRRGAADDRALWPQMFRIILEAKPRWVIAENVGGFLSINKGMEFENCLASLESAGYEVQAFVIPACAVDAPHRRDRVWIVAYAKQSDGGNHSTGSDRWRSATEQETISQINGETHTSNAEQVCSPLADTRSAGFCEQWQLENTEKECDGSRTQEYEAPECGDRRSVERGLGGMVDGFSCWLDEPDIPRVTSGQPDRAARLKALGNAIVPQVAIQIMQAIKMVDEQQ